jgi:pyruvate carboxylase
VHDLGVLTSQFQIRYRSLGTFEFLLNPSSGEFYFLEINPRLQVEHTITESICSLDIVKIQFQLAQGLRIDQTDLADISQDPLKPPPLRSIQLRVTAEDPEKNYSLSVGKIQSFHFPSGNGIRVDTALVHGVPASVGPDFDSVIAKIIVTARTWDDVVRKAQRAVQDTAVSGIKTNLDLLAAILAHPDFLAGNCDTQWLEANHADLIALGHKVRDIKAKTQSHLLASQPSPSISATANSSSGPLFRPKDAWTLSLTPKGQPASSTQQHHLALTRILRNDFPASLSAEITHTSPSSASQNYTLSLTSTTSSASASGHRLGSPSDPSHVLIPFAGTLVEVLVDEGDEVAKGDVVCVVRQMKMELEVRAPRSGVVGFVMEVEDGGEVGEGMLAATVLVVEGEGGERARL